MLIADHCVQAASLNESSKDAREDKDARDDEDDKEEPDAQDSVKVCA